MEKLTEKEKEYFVLLEKKYGKGEILSKKIMIYFQEKYKFEQQLTKKENGTI